MNTKELVKLLTPTYKVEVEMQATEAFARVSLVYQCGKVKGVTFDWGCDRYYRVAKQTAEEIAAVLGLPVYTRYDLKVMNVGIPFNMGYYESESDSIVYTRGAWFNEASIVVFNDKHITSLHWI